ncbi:MAG: hypothetical protein V7761_02515, partial [Amylibacter sp.]
RTAYIRTPEPILISPDTQAEDVPMLLEELRLRMQTTLDEINADLEVKGDVVKYSNVFLQ